MSNEFETTGSINIEPDRDGYKAMRLMFWDAENRHQQDIDAIERLLDTSEETRPFPESKRHAWGSDIYAAIKTEQEWELIREGLEHILGVRTADRDICGAEAAKLQAYLLTTGDGSL